MFLEKEISYSQCNAKMMSFGGRLTGQKNEVTLGQPDGTVRFFILIDYRRRHRKGVEILNAI
jgi:hypothetical protein